MPTGTRVDRCFQRLKTKRSASSAAAICQKSTGQVLATGKPMKHGEHQCRCGGACESCKQRRLAERFCQSGPNAGKPGPCPEFKRQPIHQRLAHKVGHLVNPKVIRHKIGEAWRKIKQVPAAAKAIKDNPWQAGKQAGQAVAERWRKLEDRYGRAGAIAMVGAYVGAWGLWGYSPGLGAVLAPEPAAQILAIAEAARKLSKKAKALKRLKKSRAQLATAHAESLDPLRDIRNFFAGAAQAGGAKLPKVNVAKLEKALRKLSGKKMPELSSPDKFSESATIDGAEIFRSGLHRGKRYTPSDLDDMARNFAKFSIGDDAMLKIPVVIGHEENQEWTGAPAQGWVERVWTEVQNCRTCDGSGTIDKDGKDAECDQCLGSGKVKVLLADFRDVSHDAADLIGHRVYRKISSEVYDDGGAPDVPAKGKMLRRVAILGGTQPQIKGLKDIPRPEKHAEKRAGYHRIELLNCCGVSGCRDEGTFTVFYEAFCDSIREHCEATHKPGPCKGTSRQGGRSTMKLKMRRTSNGQKRGTSQAKRVSAPTKRPPAKTNPTRPTVKKQAPATTPRSVKAPTLAKKAAVKKPAVKKPAIKSKTMPKKAPVKKPSVKAATPAIRKTRPGPKKLSKVVHNLMSKQGLLGVKPSEIQYRSHAEQSVLGSAFSEFYIPRDSIAS